MTIMRPLHDRILVRPSAPESKTKGGLFIPDNAKERPMEASVVAVGKGKRLDDGTFVTLEVKAGDRVLIGKFSGSHVRIDETEYLIVREDEVLAVLP